MHEPFEMHTAALPERHLERVEREVRAQTGGRLPADDETTEDIDDERHIEHSRRSTARPLVNPSGGATEAHFHFFVMVAMLAAYEEWVPYLLAISFVVVHYGLVGVLAPELVYSNADAIHSPWKWALIHAGFILALSAVSIISWRLKTPARSPSTRTSARGRASASSAAPSTTPRSAWRSWA